MWGKGESNTKIVYLMFQIRTDIRVCVYVCTRVSQEETSLLFPCSSTTNNSLRGTRRFDFDPMEEKKERERKRSDKVSRKIVENGATGFVKY